jgi:ATP-dependent helicase/nuclease subunit B
MKLTIPMRFACPGLLPIIESGTTVIVPSHLLARVTSNDFGRDLLSRGIESWERPDIHNPLSWLKSCWEKARYKSRDVPALLSAPQERMLWQQIIKRHTPDLFNIESTAELAMRAGSTLAEWHIPLDHDAWQQHEDGIQFRTWVRAFRQKCNQEGWTTSAALWSLVPTWITAGLCEDAPVVFAGFRNTTPALSHLREALGARATVLELERTHEPARTALQACDDFPQELELAARGARFAFESDPEKSIAVFVPELHAHCTLVERVFHEIFYPGDAVARLRRPIPRDSVFHIYVGRPLSEHPMIAAAMLLLRLGMPRIPIGEASAILRSPWIAGAEQERSERALGDLQVRRSRELDVTLADLQYATRLCPTFQKVLHQVRDALSDKPTYDDLSRWSETFNDVLQAAGWPGKTKLDQDESELLEELKDKLSQLASLSLVSGKLTYEGAVARLGTLLDIKRAGAGDLFSPIQILGAEDAAGIRFDQAFIVGLSEESSLFRPPISPLIPASLQRACGVPGSSPNASHLQRQQLVLDLLAAGSDVCVSYSHRILPMAEPLLSSARHGWSAWDGRAPQQAFSPAALERIEDSQAPPYMGSGGPLGGTGVIKDQSQCPFRAFASRRLKARSLEEGSFGLDSRERGGFVHEALRIVWDELRTQKRLRNMPGFELQFVVNEAVDRAVRTKNNGPLHEQLSKAEAVRLSEVILEWLEVECRREKPFEVEATEQQQKLEIAGLALDIRIDRVDRLRDGKFILIDYKSGETKAANLNGDRPREPQLLTYAAAMREAVDGFFFAQLKPRCADLVGFAREKHIANQKPPGKDLSWDEYLEDRIATVERLAAAFANGQAAVDPIKEACKFCDVGPLCRISEVRGGGGEAGLD